MRVTAYVHCDKETMWELGEKHGLSDDALSMFRHALDEVEVVLQVDKKTGIAHIVRVNGRQVGA